MITAFMNVTKRPVVALLAGVSLVAMGSVVLLGSFRQILDASAIRRQSLVVLGSANDLLSAMKDAETGQRGFLLTGDEAFLEPYLAVRDSIALRVGTLRRLSAESATHKDLDALAPLLDAKLAGMAHLIELRRNQDVARAQALVSSGEGRRQMDAIRAVVRSVAATEQAALDRRDDAFGADLRRLLSLIIITTLLALLCAIAFAIWVRQRAQQRLANAAHVDTEQSLEIQEATNAALQQANVTLAESEERLEVTLASIGDAVMTTDASARVSGLNPVAERLTGWTTAQAAGRPVSEVFQIINKETRLSATIPVAETLAHGTVHGLANHTVLIARDGSERDIADSCAPIRDRTGQVIGAVLVFRDVTDEYAVQQALNDSSALIETVLTTAADGIITFHASGGVVAKANPAAQRIFGYPAAELIGREFSLLVPELERDQLAHALEYYRPSDEARAKGLGREVTGRRKDGSTVPIEMAVSDMMLGGQRYFTCIVRDITARKEAEMALQRAGPLQSAIFNSANFSSIATDA
ncbi:MAG: PAS domain S-box protein, partial [Gemmatimonadota bacterium]